MNRFSARSALLVAALCLAPLLAGCSANDPWLMDESTIAPANLSLVESRHIVKRPLSEISDIDVDNAAKTYTRTGAGPVYVVVAHKEDGKSTLGDRAQAMADKLIRAGVPAKDIVASTVPLETDVPVALIAFDTIEAQAPKGCTDMPGLKTTPGQVSDFDYKLGCGTKDLMARQISDPRELTGVAGLGGYNDGERGANIVNGLYRTGATRDYLPSYVISALAGSGG